MRAVRGRVVSSKALSLSKAAAMLSDFAKSGACSRPETAAYVRRASAAFDELVALHREIGASGDEDDGSRSRKKRKRGEAEAADREGKGSRKIKFTKILPFTEEPTTRMVPGERLLAENTNTGLQGSDEKRKKKEKKGYVNDDVRFDLERKGDKRVEVEGHEKEDKKKKQKREVSYKERGNFEKNDKVDEETRHGGAVERNKMTMDLKVQVNDKEKHNLGKKVGVSMEEDRHEKEEKKDKEKKRKREGGDEKMSPLNEKEEKKVRVKEETHETTKSEKFDNKERDKKDRHSNNLDIEEQRELDDTSERHKKKRRKKEHKVGEL